MELIDTQLGGTIPLDFVIDANEDFFALREELQEADDSFEDPFGEGEETPEMTYWFNSEMLEKVEEIHDHLEQSS